MEITEAQRIEIHQAVNKFFAANNVPPTEALDTPEVIERRQTGRDALMEAWAALENDTTRGVHLLLAKSSP